MRFFVILMLVFIFNFKSIGQVDKTKPVDRPKTIDRTTIIDKTTPRDKRDRTTREIDKTIPLLDVSRPGLILKWSPSPLISFTAPTIQFSLEYPIGKITDQFYLEHDIGYVYADPNIVQTNVGFRFGTRIKYYFRPVTTHFDNFYVSVMARHTQRHEKGRDYFDRGGGAYQQLLEYKEINKYNSGYLELGYMTRFGKDERVTFEIFGGGGFQYNTETFKDVPADADIADLDDGLFTIATETMLPSIIIVMKFGYVLKSN